MATAEVNKPPSLPPYPEMIMNAIEALNEPNGLNKSSISKFIESTYGDLPGGHSALLSEHLNNMKESGQLVFWKNNYSKPDPNAPPRRGRGRPPKPKDASSMPPSDMVLSPAKPRGRPPKDPNAPPKDPNAPQKPAKVKVKVSSGSGKPRGRPRKMAKHTGGLSDSTMPTDMPGKPRGRPPKVKDSLSTEVSVEQ